MKKYLLGLPLFLMCFTFSGADEFGSDNPYGLQEEDCDEEDVCRMPAAGSSSSTEASEYEYDTPDTDASWPGKKQDSFIDGLMK